MKDGGKGAERKSAIVEILDYENRLMYFIQKDTVEKIFQTTQDSY